ncbi:MAG: alpha/beta hydrolase [Muribaculum sp.]|nr:alpha/beta hydrolase [Muribaculum sp.]
MDRHITVNGATVHYTVSEGDGKPIVLMHGWGCNTTTLASIEKVAVDAGCKVYNIDFPGHGESPDPPAVWGVEEYTQVLEKIVDAEAISRPSLLGHSFGGRVGILYSSRHDDVDKLILVDAAGIKPRRSAKYYVKVYSFKAWKKWLYMLMGKEKAEKKLDAYRAKAGSSDYAGASPRMRAILSKVVNEDLKHRMPHIKASTLLIWGENDTATPLSDAKYMERNIPGAGLVSFPGCGHYSFLDNPYQFAAVLRSFLTS